MYVASKTGTEIKTDLGANDGSPHDTRADISDAADPFAAIDLETIKENARILVIDDEPANLFLLTSLLEDEDFVHVKTVQDSRKALEVYDAFRPDLTLLDIRMPHMDGHEVMRGITERNDPVPAPVIFLTAESTQESLRLAFEGGARDFLVKPFDLREIVLRVVNQLEMHFTKKVLHDQKAILEHAVRVRTAELEQSRLDVINHLSIAAEYRDKETGNHIKRMSLMCGHLARTSGWSEAGCALIVNASRMHDVGKIGVPDEILLKPGPLSDKEFAIMRTHSAIGADILKGNTSGLVQMAWEIASAHHERWDGTGYPKGIKGTEIPESARIAAIADVYDALRSKRPYKQPWAVDDAVAAIRDGCGTQFDPDLVALFMGEVDTLEAIRATYQ